MAQICEQCGMNLYDIPNEPFIINDEKALCYYCAQPICEHINQLYNLKTKHEFDLLREEILSISRKHYDEKITNALNALMDNIYTNTSIPHTEQQLALNHIVKNHLLTTGFDFIGYNIIKYVGVISGQVVLGTGFLSEFTASFSDFFGAESNKFADKLETAKNAAVEKLTRKSAEKGGNAIIGVDFDYITFHGNMIGVVANGTSVVIEEIKDNN